MIPSLPLPDETRVPGIWPNLREDFRRYRAAQVGYGAVRASLNVLAEYGFLALVVYRYGRWARGIRPRLLSYPFKLVYIVLRTLIDILFGISLSVNCEIGPGFYIGHYGGIVVHGKIGRQCSIGQGVTIGAKGAGKSNGWPELGDNVYVGAGAKIIGAIRIGDDVVIGANTVVVKDVPARMRVVGGAVRMTPIGVPHPDDDLIQ
jgi:serine O-acetyltransferase